MRDASSVLKVHTAMEAIWLIKDADGYPLDARLEIDGGAITLHSRSGGPPRNTKYQMALGLILSRLSSHSDQTIDRIVLDSNRVRHLPISDRVLATQSDVIETSIERLQSSIGRRMRDFAKSANAKKHGNSTKRLRIETKLRQTEAIRIIRATSYENAVAALLSHQKSSDETLSDEDRGFVEGAPRRVHHLRRERAHGLSAKKKAEYRRIHGKLVCERCGFDPVEEYGAVAGEACIEVHHTIPIATMMPGQKTRLADLQCLCANCHRVLHEELRLEEDT
ncbi:HNH endonuclease [Pontixanthobacter sp. CEM42]|uniref:HNH endonuclease n=1 Tax=Pontixanthobacter sp. CEM42 TaxID=2792077 RepID=UPI001ADEE22B|nr:HNH endonuclease [Pontixanthobacter sp. CEM42]